MSTFMLKIRRTVVRTVVTSVAVVGGLEVTTHLPSQGRSSEFYHYVSDQVALPILRKVLDPERAHELGLQLAQRGLAPTFRPSAAEQSLAEVTSRPFRNYPTLQFDNCIGLAAGFDKNGVAIQPMLNMGFGFVEIGSVTPEPQAGNPKPRMFRLSADKGVINRYGFNSEGANAVAENLKEYRNPTKEEETTPDLAANEPLHKTVYALEQIADSLKSILQKLQRPPVQEHGVLGVNLGKNKTSENEIGDYQVGIEKLGKYADYLVINVSSPNTPGLRDLQHADKLKRLLRATMEARDALAKPVPLLVKLAPDLTEEELKDIAEAVVECGVDGLIVCNTTVARPSSVTSPEKKQAGGLSGAPLKDISTECIRTLYSLTDGTVPIIGVGGVSNGRDAYEKLKAGASLVQIYSCMVYEGPGVVSRIRQELAECMLQNGQRRLEDVVGLDHVDLYWKRREALLASRRNEEKTFLVE
jgi:dihydroorotate dehydrogenase